MTILQKIFKALQAKGYCPEWRMREGHVAITMRGLDSAAITMRPEATEHSKVIYDRAVVIQADNGSTNWPGRSCIIYHYDKEWRYEEKHIHEEDARTMDNFKAVMNKLFGITS